MNTITIVTPQNHNLNYIIYSPNNDEDLIKFSISISTPEASFDLPCCYVDDEFIRETIGRFTDDQQNCKVILDDDTGCYVEITPMSVAFHIGSITWRTNNPTIRVKLIGLFRKLAA